MTRTWRAPRRAAASRQHGPTTLGKKMLRATGHARMVKFGRVVRFPPQSISGLITYPSFYLLYPCLGTSGFVASAEGNVERSRAARQPLPLSPCLSYYHHINSFISASLSQNAKNGRSFEENERRFFFIFKIFLEIFWIR